MLPLLGRPLIEYTFDHLRTADVSRIVLACGYLPDAIVEHFGAEIEGVPVEYKVEPTPLGTGGAIRFAADGADETFLALNGDSLREADLRHLLAFHRMRGAKATILLTRVHDPSRYGLVTTARGGRVTGFLEKPRPEEIVTDQINAGLYILEPEVLELIEPGRAVSIEREVFPQLVAEGSLFGLALPGYWLDVGTPASYLQAHLDLMARESGIAVDALARVSAGVHLCSPVVIGPGVEIQRGSRVGPFVHVGSGARVAEGALLQNTAVLPRAHVGIGARLKGAIVAPEIGEISL